MQPDCRLQSRPAQAEDWQTGWLELQPQPTSKTAATSGNGAEPAKARNFQVCLQLSAGGSGGSKADYYTLETMLSAHVQRTSQIVVNLSDLVCTIASQSGCRPRAQKGPEVWHSSCPAQCQLHVEKWAPQGALAARNVTSPRPGLSQPPPCSSRSPLIAALIHSWEHPPTCLIWDHCTPVCVPEP